MTKAVKKTRRTSFLIIFIEILLVLIFCLFYFLNIFNLKEVLNSLYLVITCVSLILVNCVVVWIVILISSIIRLKSDTAVEDIIGSDVQEIYNFTSVGLIVTDDQNIILWANELFQKSNLDILGLNIFEWQPNLIFLKENLKDAGVAKISLNSRTYEVKLLPESGLWIFKDVSDFETAYKYSKLQSPVIGILSIDNYDDIISTENTYSDDESKLKSSIFLYFKEFNVLLRRAKEDLYFLLSNYQDFEKMRNDKFSILDKVREVKKGSNVLTLSIGFAYDFPDVIKLNEYANDALEVALSRGGDQVVVSPYGREMEFYGGKYSASESNSKVKIRTLADSIISFIKNCSNVVIMGHANMDMDALGACLGMACFAKRFNKEASIIVDFKNTELKTRNAILSSFDKDELDGLFLDTKQSEELIQSNTLLIVVDCHNPTMVMDPKLIDLSSKIMVIDHHRRGKDFIDTTVFNHIDTSSSSTCEIIAELVKYASINPRIEIPSLYATIMLSGIFLDSSYFKSKSTGMKTFEAATVLKDYGADNTLADDFLKEDYEEHLEVNSIIQNLETPIDGIVISYGNENEYHDGTTLARASDLCMTFKGVKASFVLGKINNKEVKLSARSNGSINVQLLCEKMGGGGHFQMSAVTFVSSSIEECKNILLNVLDTDLESASNYIKKVSEE